MTVAVERLAIMRVTFDSRRRWASGLLMVLQVSRIPVPLFTITFQL